MVDNLSTSNSKKVFAYKALQLILLVVILDFTIGKSLQYLYFRQISGPYNRIRYSIEKTKEDIIIFGSSRAMRHYAPRIFEKNFALSCYNTGRGGQSIFFSYAVQKSILKRYKPKIFVLDVLPTALLKNQRAYSRLWELLPYYKTHKEMRVIIAMRSSFEKWKLLSHIYPYNSTILTMIKYNFRQQKNYQGYIPVQAKMKKKPAPKKKVKKFQIDQNKIDTLKAFISSSQKAGIKVFVVISPIYTESDLQSKAKKILKAMLQKNKIKLWDYSHLYEKRNELFYDKDHLNDKGSKLFSKLLVKEIGYLGRKK